MPVPCLVTLVALGLATKVAAQPAEEQPPASETPQAPSPSVESFERPESHAGSPPPPEDAATTETDIDAAVAAMGLPATMPTEVEERRLSLYGFADVGFYKLFLGEDNPWRQFVPPRSSFMVGNINVYLDAAITSRLRSLIEVRYLYSPHGAEGPVNASTGEQRLVDNSLQDPAELGRIISWGAIVIERAWIEYQLLPWLTLRAGQFLTPYGIWNVDHGSPTLIGIRRPLIVREQIFPERQTGLELHGRVALADLAILGYHLTISNGRGLADAYRDTDENKAVGGRLVLQTMDRGTASLGFSMYGGRRSDLAFQWGLDAMGRPMRRETYGEVINELAFAFDLRLNLAGLLVQAEFANADRVRVGDRGWQEAPDSPGFYQSNNRRNGVYVLAGYRTPWFGIMPYGMVEFFNPTGPGPLRRIAGDYGDSLAYYAGLNVRPIPHFVLKIELAYGTFVNGKKGSAGDHSITGLQTQVAWVF